MDTSSGPENIPLWLKEKRRELATDNVNRSYESAFGLLKWILTSTLVLHSTALVAALGSANFAKVLLSGPAWLFVAGIGCTFAGGLTLAVSAAEFAGQMSGALWKGEGLDGEVNAIFDPEPNRTSIMGATLLGLSIACFMLGSGFSIMAINKQPNQVVSANARNK
ncbi:hypothetical protein [Sphingomonas sp. MJ1 (PH-R8)]|uniref:hypothetical protein n=1 Tax=Sphingomonas sp. MJ1 (PH-R8) TaxID=3112950 RepID=UPI003A8AF6BF